MILNPLNKLLDYVPIFNKPFDAKHIQEKLGIWGRNDVMGFIIGVLLGFGAGYGLSKSLTLGVEAAAAMTLFPMISKLFMEALNPIATAMGNFMKRHFKNREVYIGVDWPILAGRSEFWVTLIILVPVELIFAMILPGNRILPFAGIINLSFGVAALLLTGANLLRMLVLGIITTPIFLYGGTYFAPMITRLAKTTHAVHVPAGTEISWSTFEGPDFRLFFGQAFAGKWWAIICAILWILGFMWLYRTVNRAPLPSKRYVQDKTSDTSANHEKAAVSTPTLIDDYKKLNLDDLDGQDFGSVSHQTLNKANAVKSVLDTDSQDYKKMNLNDLDGHDFNSKHR